MNTAFKKDKKFKSPFIEGEFLYIEINIKPSELRNNNVILEGVGHYFYNTKTLLTSINASPNLDCLIDVNCSEGDEWCNQIRSVAVIHFRDEENGRLHRCTGSLINDVNSDFNKQYFLTARHCTNDGNTDWETTSVHFNFQNIECDVINASNYSRYSVQGLTERSFCDVADADGALLEILEPIPLQYNVYYSGWDVLSQELYTNVHIIHHPRIAPKKITAGQIQLWLGPKWEVYWDNGMTQGGSSGAPLFKDENKNIIGINSGSWNEEHNLDCDDDNHQAWVGKLLSCWGVSSMKDYLANGSSSIKVNNGNDPIIACQDNIELNGEFHDAREYNMNKHQIHLQAKYNISISNNNRSDFFVNSNFKLTASERISFLPGNILFSGTHIARGAIFSAYIAPCSADGYCENENESSNKKSTDLSVKSIDKNQKYNLYPNPYSENFNIKFNTTEIQNVSIQILNSIGEIVYEESLKSVKGENNHAIQLEVSDKLLFTKICIGDECFNAKLLRK